MNEWESTERNDVGPREETWELLDRLRALGKNCLLLCLVSHQSESGKFKGYFTHQTIQVQEL